jgi:CHAT domain-containing protein
MILLGLVVWRQTNVFILEPVLASVESGQFTPLPKIDSIGQVLEKANHDTGPQLSTEEANTLMNKVKKGEYRIVQFATHGYFVRKSRTETTDNNEE